VSGRRGTGEYPPDWPEIAGRVKDASGWKCIRCGAPHGPPPHVLTVHHLDGDKSNCAWWNLAALCQRCHLHIQAMVVMQRVWYLEHSEWFKPYVAGYVAATMLGLDLDRETATRHAGILIALHQGWVTPLECMAEIEGG